MKRGTPDHRKMKALAKALGIPLPYANGLMERLWHYCSQYVLDGGIGKLTDEEISEAAGWGSRRGPATFTLALLNSGWLDRDYKCRLFVHDWPEHCDDTVHRVLARRKQFFANGAAPTLTRLGKKDRELAEEFYSQNARVVVEAVRAQDAHDVRTVCAMPKALSLKPKATASSDAVAAPSPTDLLDVHPETAAAIRARFEDADESLIRALITKCAQEVLSAGETLDVLTDEVLAYAVNHCTKPKQQSAGLYLTTVPNWIRNKAMTQTPEEHYAQ